MKMNKSDKWVAKMDQCIVQSLAHLTSGEHMHLWLRTCLWKEEREKNRENERRRVHRHIRFFFKLKTILKLPHIVFLWMTHCLFTWDIGPLIFAIKKDTATHKAPINTTRKKKMFSNVINIIAEDHDFHWCE